MLKLNQIYFRKFFYLFFATALFVSLAGYYLLDNIEINNHRAMLKNMINLFDATRKEVVDLKTSIKNIEKKSGVRVSIIGLDGVVRFESGRDKIDMDNQKYKPEIAMSNSKDFGFSIRHSRSMDKDFLYVAKKGDDCYIRMAYPLDSIKLKFLRFWIYAILLFLIVMVVALWITIKINRKVTYDLQRIKDGLDSIIEKKYDTIFEGEKCCEEFDLITKQINRVSKRLEKRNRQKIKHTRKLKELNKQQSDIISAISHEFKNPVAAIIGYASTMREDGELSQKIRDKFLDKVVKNGQKISYMIDRLSMAIKLENDNFSLSYKKFDLSVMLDDVKDTLLQKYRGRDIVLEVPSVMIQADEVMFENMLINLIENALKYSESEVIVKLEGTLLKIMDRGIGIDSQEIQNITKRFYRVESLDWDNSLGVGLYIVKYILKLHKIDLQIKSEIGVGSEFYFDIESLKKSQ